MHGKVKMRLDTRLFVPPKTSSPLPSPSARAVRGVHAHVHAGQPRPSARAECMLSDHCVSSPEDDCQNAPQYTDLCDEWARFGECRISEPFMRFACARSCRFCVPKRTEAPTTTTTTSPETTTTQTTTTTTSTTQPTTEGKCVCAVGWGCSYSPLYSPVVEAQF